MEDNQLKQVIITGGNAGLGFQSAKKLFNQGYDVIIGKKKKKIDNRFKAKKKKKLFFFFFHFIHFTIFFI